MKCFKSDLAPPRQGKRRHAHIYMHKLPEAAVGVEDSAKGKSSAPLNYWLNKLHVYSGKMPQRCFTLFITEFCCLMQTGLRHPLLEKKKRTQTKRYSVRLFFFFPSFQQQKKKPVRTATARKQPHRISRQAKFQSCCWFAGRSLTRHVATPPRCEPQ